MTRLILTADDLGCNVAVNQAIAEGFAEHLLTHSSILANGSAFEHGCDLAEQSGWKDRVGIHLCATEGPSLTKAIRDLPSFCDEGGRFHYRRGSRLWLSGREADALTQEWRAQIDVCQARGIALSHADGHHHIHAEPWALAIIAPILRDAGIARLRLSDNLRRSPMPRRLYKAWFNRAIAKSGLRGSDYFGDQDALPALAGLDDGAVVEIMLHPGRSEVGELIDLASGMRLRDILAAFVNDQRVPGKSTVYNPAAQNRRSIWSRIVASLASLP